MNGPVTERTKWTLVYSTIPGDYYGDTIEVAEEGWIRVQAGGHVVVMPSLREIIKKLVRE